MRYRGFSKAFDWACTTPRLVMPRMRVLDYDGDGEKEIAVSINAGSGTSLSLDELHIVTPRTDAAGQYDDLEDVRFMPEDYLAQIASGVSYGITDEYGKTLVSLSSERGSIICDITGYAQELSATAADIELAFGNIIEFTPLDNGRITLAAGLGALVKWRAEPFYIAELTADVAYSGGSFYLSNINLSADMP